MKYIILIQKVSLCQEVSVGINKSEEFCVNNVKYAQKWLYYKRLLNNGLVDLAEDKIKSSGYVLDSLDATLCSLLNSNNYKECILKAVKIWAIQLQLLQEV